jgi:SNF family Na+-dependent transporter
MSALSCLFQFGVMTAFGSHCEKNAPAVENALVIAIANSTFSVLSGLCIFAILGYLSTVEMDFRVDAGPAFLFGAYPAALSTIPGGIWWVRFLFFNLILLGLDSAFAMVEGVVSVIEDSSYNVLPKRTLVSLICGCGFLCGLMYTTDAALEFLDVIDFYVNFVVLFLGFCKSFSAGWIYGLGEQIRVLGFNVVYAYMASTFGSILLASLVWFGVAGNTAALGFFCLFVVYGSGIYYCWNKMKENVNIVEGRTMESMRHTLLMSNIVSLKDELSTSIGYIPNAWAVVMKHVIPQVLLVLFFNLAFAKTDAGNFQFGDYKGYSGWPFQFLGVCCVLLVFGIVIVGLAKTDIFKGFVDAGTKEMEMASNAELGTGYDNMDNVEVASNTVLETGYKNMDDTEEPVVVVEESERSEDDDFVKL